MMAFKTILPQGKNAWILTVAVAGVILLGVVIAVGPVRNRFLEIDEAIASGEKALGNNLAIVAPGPSEAVERDYQRCGDTIRMRGSSEEENSRMLSEVDRLAGENKVVLTATKPQETRKTIDSEAYGVEVEVEADMAALMGFLYAIETSPQLLRIERLVLDSKGGKAAASHRGTILISKVVTL